MDNNYSPRDTASSASGHNNFVEDNNGTLKSPDGVVSTNNFKSIKNSDNTNDVKKSEDSPPRIKRRNDLSVFDDAVEPSVFDNAVETRPGLVWHPYQKEFVPLSTTAAGIPPKGVPRTTSLPKKPTDPAINSAKKLATDPAINSAKKLADADAALPPKMPPQKLTDAVTQPIVAAPKFPAIGLPLSNKAKEPCWILSKKKLIREKQMSPGVKPYEHGNDHPALLSDVYGINMSTVYMVLDDITSRKSKKDIDSADLNEVARLARTTSTTPRRTDVNFEEYVPTKEKVAAICNAVDNVNIQYNDYPTCICCKEPAVTSRRAKPDDEKKGPGSHKLEYCMLCGKKVLGDDRLDHPCVRLCGNETFGTCSECETCRRNAPCIADGCDEGGNGKTHPWSGLCRMHYNLSHSIVLESLRDVHSCLRCGRDLLHLRNSASGASKNICTVPSCADKCVFQDDSGNWCNNDREEGCYCRTHFLQLKSKGMKEWNEKRKNGTYKSPRWTTEEVKVLTELTQKHKSKKGGKVDWDAVFQEFSTHQEFDRTRQQMIEKMKAIRKSEKKKE